MSIEKYKSHSVTILDNILYFYLKDSECFQISIITETGYDDLKFPISDIVYYLDTKHYYPLLHMYCKTYETD